MLVVVMHNNRNYVTILDERIKKEGILNTTIIEERNIGTRLIGSSASFTPQLGVIRPAYDRALIIAVHGEEKLKCIMRIIEEDVRLAVLNLKDKGFVCTVPFMKLKNIAFEPIELEAHPKLDVKICNHLDREKILLDLKATNRDDAIREIAGLLKTSDKVIDLEVFIKKVLEREKMNTTGIGDEIAIPHARGHMVKALVMAFGRSSSGIDFKSLDGTRAKLIFLIGALSKDTEVRYYLEILARLSKLLRNQNFRNALLEASTPEEIMGCFNKSAVLEK